MFRSTPRRGQGLGEYGLILALVAVIAIVGVGLFGDTISSVFNSANSAMGSTGAGGSEPTPPAGPQATAIEFGIGSYTLTDNGDGTATLDYIASGSGANLNFNVWDGTNSSSTTDGAPGTAMPPCGGTITLNAELADFGGWGIASEVYAVDCATGELTQPNSVALEASLSDDGTNMTVALTATSFGDPVTRYYFDIGAPAGTYFNNQDGASNTFEFQVPCSELASTSVFAGVFTYDSGDTFLSGSGLVLPACAS